MQTNETREVLHPACAPADGGRDDDARARTIESERKNKDKKENISLKRIKAYFCQKLITNKIITT